jgi:hypothetical protein
MKLDIEKVEELLINFVKNNLTTKLAEIDSEKNDGIVLSGIPTAAYFDTFTSEINNVENFIYYTINDVTTDGIGPSTASTFSMFIVVYSPENFNSENSTWRKKSFRYSRAIQEIIQENSKDVGAISQLTISIIIPQAFALNEDSPIYKVGGVSLSGIIV